MKNFFKTIIRILIFTPLFLTACGSVSKDNDDTLKVLASTTFLADIAQNVAGDRLQIESLLPIGADPHAYQAAPSDVAKIAESDVLILNGLEYEHFIEPLLENAGGERLVIVATDGLTPHPAEEHDEETGAGEGHDHEAGDPHMWLDPNLVIQYVENIRAGLIQIDSDGAEIYKSNTDEYIQQLKDLDTSIRGQVDQIPRERRLLVTNHEALGYFAEQYGFRIVGAVIPSLSTDAAPAAGQMADLIDEINASGVSAIFLEQSENPIFAQQIAEETGVQVVADLHLETLTDGAPAGTYLDMMKYNVTLIVTALK
jgi:ABC-type Zn uptake system ZnuABC Zn-binding protein ZnuA